MAKITLNIDVDEDCLDQLIVKELERTLDNARCFKKNYALKEDRKYYKKLAKHLKTVLGHFGVDYKK